MYTCRVTGRTAHGVDKAIKKDFSVARARGGLRVKLHRKERLVLVRNALVRAVVGVDV